jgi:hypothetical protein
MNAGRFNMTPGMIAARAYTTFTVRAPSRER